MPQIPQDTTIYWDGNGQLPALIDSLDYDQQKVILELIHDARDSQHTVDSGAGIIIMAFTIFMIFFFITAIYAAIDNRKKRFENSEDDYLDDTTPVSNSNSLIYQGSELGFSNEILKTVLIKHFPYYNLLNDLDKDKFIHRLQKFISRKTFIIHDKSGFREMPILISAAAIQLSFGFEKYLLPDFPNIQIYPEEFLGIHPSIRYLEGNVSNSCINISWKHFLNGFKYPDDGQNVGLHEMAHAYHFQNFETGNYKDEGFTGKFPQYDICANKAFSQEALSIQDLFSDYALRNFQEFWAESVEIFFEKPVQLKKTYPDLYNAMCELMNQQPLANSTSV